MNGKPLDNSVALITGAGRGIGAGIARRFAEAGARLVLAARTEGEIEALADELRPVCGAAIAVPADVTVAKEVDECVAAAVDTFGGVDILVNAAGSQYISTVGLSAPEDWIRDVDVNLIGTYRFCRACLPALARSRGGRIVNIASRMGKSPAPLNSAYSASKAGVIAFTASLAAEVARDGIVANAVCPGYVETKLLNDSVASVSLLTGRAVEDIKKALARKSMLRRAVTVGEVAELALFLASEASGMTGQAINISGGAELR